MTETLDLIQQGIDAMFDSTDIVEVRVPKAGKFGTISGYFEATSPNLAKEIQKLSGQHDGIYVTLNPCKPALLARASNRTKTRSNLTTSDHDILQRIHLLVDIDPVRPAGVSSTNAELDKARVLSRAVYKYLKDLGWAEPLIAESGNGFHLVYNIDLPNSKENSDLVKGVLNALAANFDNEFAKVDTSVFNAARIVKAYGSLSAKGDSTEERPHRISRVLRSSAGIVTIEQMRALAPEQPSAQPNTKVQVNSFGPEVEIDDDKMEACLAFHEIGHHGIAEGTVKGQSKWVLDACPFNPDHVGKDAAVFLTEGGPGFKCLHNSCADNHWLAFRAKIEELSGGRQFSFATGGEKRPWKGTIWIGGYNADDAQIRDDVKSLAAMPEFNKEILEDGWIGELAVAASNGTTLPPQFLYNLVKVGLGAMVDGKVGHPAQTNIHTRHYTMNLANAGVGKSASLLRILGEPGNKGVLTDLLTHKGVHMMYSPSFGSGEFMVEVLAGLPNRNILITYDEMVLLWQKAGLPGNTLKTKFLELFEKRSAEVGSKSGGNHKVENVGVNLIGNFTPQTFSDTFRGTGSKGDGFLSRFTLGFDKETGENPFWEFEEVGPIVAKMAERAELIKPATGMADKFIPAMDAEAKLAQQDFLIGFKKMHQESGFIERLTQHFFRDLVLRTVFADDPTITVAQVQRSILWVEHQLALRKRFWDVDAPRPLDAMALKITHALEKHSRASRAQLVALCNIIRDGRHDDFRRAMAAMGPSGTRAITLIGQNRKGEDMFELAPRIM